MNNMPGSAYTYNRPRLHPRTLVFSPVVGAISSEVSFLRSY